MGLCMHNTQSSYGLGCLTKYNTTILLCLPWLQTLPTVVDLQDNALTTQGQQLCYPATTYKHLSQTE
jgi:hypothetical protein